jgi:hypothetical protein
MEHAAHFYRSLPRLQEALQEQTRRENFVMHYKNGREAKVGDPVIGTAYNTKGVIVGRMVSITPGSASCNCTVAFVGDAVKPVKEDYSQCDNFFHAEDALSGAKQFFQPTQVEAAPAPTA